MILRTKEFGARLTRLYFSVGFCRCEVHYYRPSQSNAGAQKILSQVWGIISQSIFWREKLEGSDPSDKWIIERHHRGPELQIFHSWPFRGWPFFNIFIIGSLNRGSYGYWEFVRFDKLLYTKIAPQQHYINETMDTLLERISQVNWI